MLTFENGIWVNVFLHILPDRSEASTEVQDQDNITTVPLIPACLDEVASEFSTSRCDVDMYVPNIHYN